MLVFEAMPVVRRFAGNSPALRSRSPVRRSCEFLLRRTDQHGVHEQRVIGPRADDAHLDAVARIPAGKAVEAIEPVARVEVVERALAVDFEGALVAWDVDRPPPDVVLRLGMFDDALVLRRSSGLGAGVCDERAIFRDAGVLFVANRVLVEGARREVAMDLGNG